MFIKGCNTLFFAMFKKGMSFTKKNISKDVKTAIQGWSYPVV